MFKRLIPGAFALALMASPALAGAPQPTNTIELTKMSGRWYEIARFHNNRQKDCFGAFAEWVRTGETFNVTQVCRKGALTGPAQSFKAKARVVDPATNAKIKMTFFGLVSQEYWILDRAPDQSWFILATPGGNHVWLFCRQAQMPASARSQAIARIGQLGYDTGRLLFTPQ